MTVQWGTKFHSRTIGAAVAVAFVLAPAARASAQPPRPHASGAENAAPGCATAGLVVWLNTEGNGAAGSSYYGLELTNLTSHACTLAGYPGVSAVALSGHQIGSAAGRDPVHKVGVVTLAAGATATATLQIVDAGNFPPARCGQTTAAGLRVYPPGQTASKVVPFPFSACSRPGVVYLNVEAVEKA